MLSIFATKQDQLFPNYTNMAIASPIFLLYAEDQFSYFIKYFAHIGHIYRLVKCHPPLHNLHDVRGEEREKWGGCITGLWHSYATYSAESPSKEERLFNQHI